MEPETALQRAIDQAGGAQALADLLNEKHVQTILNWKVRGVPANRCPAIEAATGVSRRDLRDDWRDYWPELDHGAPATQEAA